MDNMQQQKQQQLEIEKLIEEIILTRKKNIFFEASFIIAAFAVGIAAAKLFL